MDVDVGEPLELCGIHAPDVGAERHLPALGIACIVKIVIALEVCDEFWIVFVGRQRVNGAPLRHRHTSFAASRLATAGCPQTLRAARSERYDDRQLQNLAQTSADATGASCRRRAAFLPTCRGWRKVPETAEFFSTSGPLRSGARVPRACLFGCFSLAYAEWPLNEAQILWVPVKPIKSRQIDVSR